MNKYRINFAGHLMHDGLKPGDEYYPASDVDASIAEITENCTQINNANQARIAELEKALHEAIESIENWAGYASAYFQEKHDLVDELKRLGSVLKPRM